MQLPSLLFKLGLTATVLANERLENSNNIPIAQAKNGTYGGIRLPGFDQEAFLGIRYAQKVNRFTRAEPLNETWNGVKLFTEYKEHCWGYGIAWTGPNADWSGYPMSEDCLYLNIIRPAGVNITSRLPVAVWIHGGGFAKGGGSDKRYNYSYVIQDSVEIGKPFIGITINYRLSVWGWLMGKEAVEGGAVNLGYHDMRHSLRWINENIASFGGDPAKVTIVGESCGAEALAAQILAYNGRDDGLFRAAIGESGFGGRIPRLSPGGFNSSFDDQAVYDRLIANTSCAAYLGKPESLDCLKAAPFDEINNAVNISGIGNWVPVMDGDFIQDYPSNQFRDGRFVKIPILIGANSDEGSYFRGIRGNANVSILNTDEDFKVMVRPIFADDVEKTSGKTAEQLIEEISILYPNIQSVGIPNLKSWPVVINEDTPDLPYLGLQNRRGNALAGDYINIAWRRKSNLYWSKHGIPNWSFRFDATPDGILANVSAAHFHEVAYVFNDVAGEGYRIKPLVSDENRAVARQMSAAWTRMIVDLDPNGFEGSTAWPIYNASIGGGIGENMVFATNGSFVELDDFRAEALMWFDAHFLDVLGT